MTVDKIRKIIEENKDDIAFIIGNGINRYSNTTNNLSWDKLLIDLWKKVSKEKIEIIPKGISLTEFYDILELEAKKDINLQREIKQMMQGWKPQKHHKAIVNKIKSLNAPILTTNFEETLAKSFNSKLLKTNKKGFTDFYPWSSYHGIESLSFPTDGFGIWYINGMIHYHRSIRLGLTHYMGSVERARNLINKNIGKNPYAGRNLYEWDGDKTWLHIIFNKSLFIFGLGLEENETFLRWLLIERKKYFMQCPECKLKGWYITTKDDKNEGKKFFLKKIGFEVIEVNDYKNIYEDIWGYDCE